MALTGTETKLLSDLYKSSFPSLTHTSTSPIMRVGLRVFLNSDSPIFRERLLQRIRQEFTCEFPPRKHPSDHPHLTCEVVGISPTTSRSGWGTRESFSRLFPSFLFRREGEIGKFTQFLLSSAPEYPHPI